MSLVVIPTAGLGSRLGKHTINLNKSLLPYKDKPVLSHIIDNFSRDSKFIIALGYNSEQVRDFCLSAYDQLDITFVYIDDYESPAAGPGYTIRKCFAHIDQPFWYVPCDTFFEEPIPTNLDHNLIFCKQITADASHEYTTFTIKDHIIESIKFKESVNTDCFAFTGLMYIHDYQTFKSTLESNNSIEVITGIRIGDRIAELDSWMDLGNLSNYEIQVKKYQKYNFTKDDEITYICNDKVIKWYADCSIPKKKFTRANFNKDIFPSGIKCIGHFLSYDFFDGNTLYNNHSIENVRDLVSWLDQNVWVSSNESLDQQANDFYIKKSKTRIDSFLKKYPNLPNISQINSLPVKHWSYYIQRLDWSMFTHDLRPGFIHGDLQFDNIIINKQGQFKIIDWRYEFASSVIYGDIYYDLGKLLGGLVINYGQIKENNFSIDINDDRVTLKIPFVDNYEAYKTEIVNYAKAKGLNENKIFLLVPLIFWNMSPLHTPPFDKFLWYLGILLFEEYYERQPKSSSKVF